MASPASDRAAEGHPTGSGQSGQYDASNNIEDANDYAEDNSPIEDGADDAPKPQPMQKRRRVTRACDECRRKKIKCDGKQPCTHCTVYSYECTYDQPSNRRRNAAPQYIEALESQLKRAKALLHVVFPTLDLNDPNLEAHLQNGMVPQLPMGGTHPQMPHPTAMPHRREGPLGDEVADSHLESMVKATGQLDLDDEGNWDYHGHSSGLSFMRRLEQQYGDIITAPSEPSTYAKYRSVSQALESPLSTQQSPAESSSVLPAGSDLPIKQEARVLCENALIDAGTLLRVVHLPTFYKQLDRIYDVSPENYGNAENNFLPLLYSVLALGTLFPKNDHELDQASYESTIEKGYKYFRASRQLLDIADCRDLTSLQAIVFMIQFLQSSAKLSTCYAYIGVALRSALRMGLHRSLNINFTPIEAETRKRIFWVIRRMDTYVGAMLGLPRFLNDEDIDQDWPAEVDDEYITETEIRPMPEGRISVMAAFNAHTRIVQVLSKICKYVYPIKGTQSGGKNSVTYSVGYSKIREIEQDLAQWLDELPMALRPGGDAPQIIIKVQQLLRMAFGHAQLLLYRPFLHYVSQSYKSKPVDQRAFACASACVSVSRNIVHITSEMKKAGLLTGAYWFSMYTTFFAVVSILYFVLENPNSSTSYELFRDALEGKEVLAHFAKNSMAADRCSVTLNTIFERLPESVKRGGDATDTKKRRQGSSPQSLQSRPNLLKQDEFIATAPRRASTFPESIPGSKRTTLGPALPISQNHFANFGLDAGYNSPSQSSDFLDTVPSLTPTSSTTSHVGGFGVPSTHGPFQRPSFPATPLSNSFTDPSGMNVPLSDIAMMMFPNKDPMAYPNQPMTTFENNNPHAFERNDSPSMAPLPHQMSGVDMKPSPHAFIQPGLAGGIHSGARRPENEVQLFGPMPMYLMQGARAQRGFPHHTGSSSIPLPSSDGGNIQFDDILAGEEWAQTFMDPGLGLSSAGPGFGGGHSYGSVPPGMGNWR